MKTNLALAVTSFASQAIATSRPLTVHVVTHSHLDAGWLVDADTLFETVT